MTRDEILKELHYNGEYTKDVKKRLNKLIKKYHPDRNKKDSKTILTLYQIKDKLENNTLVYKQNIVKDNKIDNDFNKVTSNYIYFLETMVEKLKVQKVEIEKRIKLLYKRINKNIEEKNKKEEELGDTNFRVEELKEELLDLSKIDIIDRIIIGVFIISLTLLLIFKSVFFVVVILSLVILEIYYISIRYIDYNNKLNKLKKLKNKTKKIQKEYDTIQSKSNVLEKREIKLKKEERRIKDDIQFYNNEISKAKNKVQTKEKEMNKSDEKTYMRR